MIDFYNAFISYRHAKLDMSIASHIQRKLEHFHVPHKLKKKLKHQKINRIFRDKDELPITSDLTETITDALAKSEYLIVICSTNTKDSMWVKREIQTFLTTHTRDQIFTVLADGEPQDVIPEELLTMDREYTDANGFVHTVKVPVEPLSCDYRIPRSKADKEELPRLAAGLLGCSYDELQRRRRQYKIRQAIAIGAIAFAGLAAFGVYMSYMNHRINKTYIESLRSKSIYLANESSTLLKDGRRVDAIQLALEALPEDEDDQMPLTAPAIRAITDATGAYMSKDGIDFKPSWNYKTPHPIYNSILSDDQKYIAVQDKIGDTYCWNTETKELVLEKQFNKNPKEMFFVDTETLLISFDDHLEAYNIQTGKNIWKYEVDSVSLSAGDVICAAKSVYVNAGNGEVVNLSARDGSVKNTYKVRQGEIINSIYDLAVSPDGKKIAFADSPFMFDGSKIHIYDTATGKDTSSPLDTYLIAKMEFLDDDHLCILSTDDGFFTSIELSDSMTYIQTGYMKCSCFDSTMKLMWSRDTEYNDVVRKFGIINLPVRRAALFYAGNAAVIFDMESGKELSKFKTSSSIIAAGDVDGNGNPEFICRHGEYLFQIDGDKNNLGQIQLQVDNLQAGFATETIYLIQSYSNDVLCYNSYQEDDEWTNVKAPGNFTIGSDYSSYYADEDVLVIGATINGAEDLRVSVIDLKNGKLIGYSDISKPQHLTSNFLVTKTDDTFYGIIGDSVYKINTKKASLDKLDITLDYKDHFSNGKIVSNDYSRSELTVTCRDVSGKNEQVFTFTGIEDSTVVNNVPVYSKELNKLFIPAGSRLMVADLDSEKTSEIEVPKGWHVTGSKGLYFTMSDDHSKYLFSDRNIILVTDDSFKEQFSIRCDCTSRYGACFKDNVMYVAADNYLGLYSADDGSIIGRYDMSDGGLGESSFMFDDSKEELMIHSNGADQLSIFDMKTWKEITDISNVYCYHKETDRFYVYSYVLSKSTPGYIRHYTLEDLIAKAKKYLRGHELDEVMRTKYGL